MTATKFKKGSYYFYDDNVLVIYRGKHNGVFMFNRESSTGTRINVVDPTMITPAPSQIQPDYERKEQIVPTKEIDTPTSQKQALILEMKEAYQRWMRSKGNTSLLTNRELILAKEHCLMPNVDFVKLEKKLSC